MLQNMHNVTEQTTRAFLLPRLPALAGRSAFLTKREALWPLAPQKRQPNYPSVQNAAVATQGSVPADRVNKDVRSEGSLSAFCSYILLLIRVQKCLMLKN